MQYWYHLPVFELCALKVWLSQGDIIQLPKKSKDPKIVHKFQLKKVFKN